MQEPDIRKAPTAPLPVSISMTSPEIRYIGRFDWRDKAGPRCAWSASAVQLRFQGSALQIALREFGANEYQVVIDDVPTTLLKPEPGMGLYSLATDLPRGAHTALLVKRTEASVGVTQFQGLHLDAGAKLLTPPRARHRIEIIGDSITCGYGNEGKDRTEHFAPGTENAYLTYGAIAARKLGAEYAAIAWSGRTMYPSFTIPEIYDRALPSDPGSSWDFRRWRPDVLLINLGTNDFGGKTNPERKPWIDAYQVFLTRLRKRHGSKAPIYLATGPMMSDSWPPNRKALSTLKEYLNQIVTERKQSGDPHIHTIDFAIQDEKNGIGSDWHPSVRTHHIMAEQLTETLRRDLRWK